MPESSANYLTWILLQFLSVPWTFLSGAAHTELSWLP